MKILSILSLLLLLTNCAGSNIAKVKIGKRCTASDTSKLQEKSYVWFVSKEAAQNFDKRINKSRKNNKKSKRISLFELQNSPKTLLFRART